MALPHHQFVLSNPFALPDDSDDEDSSLNSSQPHTPSTVHPASGFRAQLNHLLPRHAFFHVNLHIYQIANIPLVSGEFAVKWKFKNAHGASGNKSGSGLLGSFKARRKARKEEKEKRIKEEYTDVTESLDGHVSTSSGNTTTTSSSSSASSKAQKSTDTNSSSSSSSPPVLLPSVSAPTTPARGQTPFLRLKDHGVVWEHTLSLLVRMDVDRDPLSMLLPCPVKLTVLQRDPTRPEVKSIPFGVVMLDLAQYASKGEVERRYLLRESKTNATLKLTTHLTHIPSINVSSSTQPPIPIASTSSNTNTNTSLPSTPPPPTTSTATNTFTAPPLPKGEILNGISSILQGDSLIGGFEGDKYRVRPKGLDLYGPYYDQEELEFGILGGRAAAKFKGKREEMDKAKHKQIDKNATPTPAPTPIRTRERSSTQSFDPSRLPLAYGTKTTELLIEALFNPVQTRHREKESPFTVYVPDLLEKMPKRPAATPIQRMQEDTPLLLIDTSPSKSGSGHQKNVSPLASFTSSPSRSGDSSSIILKVTSTSSSPATSPLLFPTVSPQFISSPSCFTSPQPSVTPSPISTPGPTNPPPPLSPSPASSSKKRAANTGIGAGLGIMGLGMGMGVGMGVRVGVSGMQRTSVEEEGERIEKKEKEQASTGVMAWLRRAAKGPSRPGTPITPVAQTPVSVTSE
ncbi:hypothetical protein C0989_002877 [Termitomyces sp. Mn162]|nr:hypothetical protein C0989_002877 [Termitomyces sp. Mn162]